MIIIEETKVTHDFMYYYLKVAILHFLNAKKISTFTQQHKILCCNKTDEIVISSFNFMIKLSLFILKNYILSN